MFPVNIANESQTMDVWIAVDNDGQWLQPTVASILKTLFLDKMISWTKRNLHTPVFVSKNFQSGIGLHHLKQLATWHLIAGLVLEYILWPVVISVITVVEVHGVSDEIQ